MGNGYSGRQTRPKTPVHITASRGSTPMVNPVLVGISFGHPPVAVLGQHLSQDPAGPLQVPLIKVFLRHPTRSASSPRPTRPDLESTGFPAHGLFYRLCHIDRFTDAAILDFCVGHMISEGATSNSIGANICSMSWMST